VSIDLKRIALIVVAVVLIYAGFRGVSYGFDRLEASAERRDRNAELFDDARWEQATLQYGAALAERIEAEYGIEIPAGEYGAEPCAGIGDEDLRADCVAALSD
jgi:hypothetical protein